MVVTSSSAYIQTYRYNEKSSSGTWRSVACSDILPWIPLSTWIFRHPISCPLGQRLLRSTSLCYPLEDKHWCPLEDPFVDLQNQVIWENTVMEGRRNHYRGTIGRHRTRGWLCPQQRSRRYRSADAEHAHSICLTFEIAHQALSSRRGHRKGPLEDWIWN